MTGANGLIGRELCTRLTKANHTVIALVRNVSKSSSLLAQDVVAWEALSGPPEVKVLDGCDAVVHITSL